VHFVFVTQFLLHIVDAILDLFQFAISIAALWVLLFLFAQKVSAYLGIESTFDVLN